MGGLHIFPLIVDSVLLVEYKLLYDGFRLLQDNVMPDVTQYVLTMKTVSYTA